ncbi:MAG: LacI family DNA-binding transcriptional regulator, partial [Ensifer adhaerens]
MLLNKNCAAPERRAAAVGRTLDMVTIKEIASAVGVSSATVSRVLN